MSKTDDLVVMGAPTGSASEPDTASSGRQRILFVSHGHPHFAMGGGEVHAYELYKAFSDHPGYDAALLARTKSPGHGHPVGAGLCAAGEDPNEVLWRTQDFDWFLMSLLDPSAYRRDFEQVLGAYSPTIVHFQHTGGMGFRLIRHVRRVLGAVPIVYTLHEYQPICQANGLMARTTDGQLCHMASPVRCHECFPTVSPTMFFVRELLVKGHLEQVDAFIAPSRFLLERYVEWGLPREKIHFIDYGRTLPGEPATDDEPPVVNFAFFGQLAPHKGLVLLLEAVRQLHRSGDRRLRLVVNGCNLEIQEPGFKEQIEELRADCSGCAVFAGQYENAEIGQRMRHAAWVVVPSLWWENSPLVIQEAFMHRRPVICSDVGGMAEKVRNGVDGIHFRCGDVNSLADALRRAMDDRGLWQRLRQNIPPVFTVDETVDAHSKLYAGLCTEVAVSRRRRG